MFETAATTTFISDGAVAEDLLPAWHTPPQVRCREITVADLHPIIDLLARGFRAERSREFWVSAIGRLSQHVPPAGFPRYGYMLESAGGPVGVILLVFAADGRDGTASVRCNVSSWYVEPSYRVFGTLLISRALKRDGVRYLNATPAPHTMTMLGHLGYKRYCEGEFLAAPLMGRRTGNACVKAVTTETASTEGLSSFEADLLTDHDRYGCLSLVCETRDGRKLPFVFASQRRVRGVPVALLVYCRDRESFVEMSRPLGRYLGRRGIFLVMLNANGPVPGLPGSYRDGRPKYYRGPHPPQLEDLAYTELAMFGV